MCIFKKRKKKQSLKHLDWNESFLPDQLPALIYSSKIVKCSHILVLVADGTNNHYVPTVALLSFNCITLNRLLKKCFKTVWGHEELI